MSKPIEAVVVLHIEEDGSYSLKVWGDERVTVLWVDERAPGDRVYCHTFREGDGEELKKLLGSDPIGHLHDGRLTDQEIQAIRAMHWRLEGGELVEVSRD